MRRHNSIIIYMKNIGFQTIKQDETFHMWTDKMKEQEYGCLVKQNWYLELIVTDWTYIWMLKVENNQNKNIPHKLERH